jgi:hypothetical protein
MSLSPKFAKNASKLSIKIIDIRQGAKVCQKSNPGGKNSRFAADCRDSHTIHGAGASL